MCVHFSFHFIYWHLIPNKNAVQRQYCTTACYLYTHAYTYTNQKIHMCPWFIYSRERAKKISTRMCEWEKNIVKKKKKNNKFIFNWKNEKNFSMYAPIWAISYTIYDWIKILVTYNWFISVENNVVMHKTCRFLLQHFFVVVHVECGKTSENFIMFNGQNLIIFFFI